jgi:hypothetical protein
VNKIRNQVQLQEAVQTRHAIGPVQPREAAQKPVGEVTPVAVSIKKTDLYPATLHFFSHQRSVNATVSVTNDPDPGSDVADA